MTWTLAHRFDWWLIILSDWVIARLIREYSYIISSVTMMYRLIGIGLLSVSEFLDKVDRLDTHTMANSRFITNYGTCSISEKSVWDKALRDIISETLGRFVSHILSFWVNRSTTLSAWLSPKSCDRRNEIVIMSDVDWNIWSSTPTFSSCLTYSH